MNATVTGYHAIEESIASGVEKGCLYVSRGEGRVGELSTLAKAAGIEVRREGNSALDRLCGHRNHRGAVLVLDKAAAKSAGTLKSFLHRLTASQVLVLILDGITDPHNLGAIVRSADQFAVDLVLVPERRAAHETDTVARVSAGASAYVPLIVVPNLAGALSELKAAGFWTYGAAADGKSAGRLDLRGKTAIVLGSEGRGLSRLLRERCDELLAIPARGHVDSFNVSVAAGILMYEVRRQQWG